jgi:hypothetical protein
VIFGVITEGSDGAESIHPVNTTATMTRRIVITPAEEDFKIHHLLDSVAFTPHSNSAIAIQAHSFSDLAGTVTAYHSLAEACTDIRILTLNIFGKIPGIVVP